jgi:hypothetical protein
MAVNTYSECASTSTSAAARTTGDATPRGASAGRAARARRANRTGGTTTARAVGACSAGPRGCTAWGCVRRRGGTTRKRNRETKQRRCSVDALGSVHDLSHLVSRALASVYCSVGVSQSFHCDKSLLALLAALMTPGSLPVLFRNFLRLLRNGADHSGRMEQWLPFCTSDQ